MVAAAEPFLRVIVRRPHAYFFLQDAFAKVGGIVSGVAAGCELADGSIAPIPGIYLLDGSGAVLERVALSSPDARDVLLEALGRASGGS